jgi:hypothetical protein
VINAPIRGASKASLNILLPRLRRGGLYVIEDWGWAHWPDDYWQGSTHQMIDEETPLSKLILELAMVVASCPSLISEMMIRPGNVYLRRGKDCHFRVGLRHQRL